MRVRGRSTAGDLDGALALVRRPTSSGTRRRGCRTAASTTACAAVRAAVFDPIAREWWSSFTAEPGDGDRRRRRGRRARSLPGRRAATGRVARRPVRPRLDASQEGRALRFRQYVDTAGLERCALEPVDMSDRRLRQFPLLAFRERAPPAIDEQPPFESTSQRLIGTPKEGMDEEAWHGGRLRTRGARHGGSSPRRPARARRRRRRPRRSAARAR